MIFPPAPARIFGIDSRTRIYYNKTVEKDLCDHAEDGPTAE